MSTPSQPPEKTRSSRPTSLVPLSASRASSSSAEDAARKSSMPGDGQVGQSILPHNLSTPGPSRIASPVSVRTSPLTISNTPATPNVVGDRKIGQSIIPSRLPSLPSVSAKAAAASIIPGTSKAFGSRKPGQQGLSIVSEGFGPSAHPSRCVQRTQATMSSSGTGLSPRQTPDTHEERLPSAANFENTTDRSPTHGGSIIRLPSGRPMASVYTRPEDVMRAEKQLAYTTLAVPEKIAQDIWANEKGKDLAPCPNNLAWTRHETYPGYRCSGGMHYIPDVLIAEGIPGLYTIARPPPELINQLTPHAKEGIPNEYFGVVRPEDRCPETLHWKYPFWSAGRI
ncbi:hypothetical protein SUNI508_06602 [Seiridium unicorne]|uniref:Uncharacterized protein n=1 Tax=Seiridium unicorne TaxID=138068 RepID=A0ABR2V074_9PEZI